MLRRILLSTCLLLPIVGYASAENPVAGQDYTVLKTPVQTQDPKKIEVLTFFAYTCPHCYTYEKDVLPWSEKLPDNVVFRQIPVAWTPKSFHFTKTYYALEAMHKLHPYHEMLFNAVIKERKEFPDLNSIADFFAQIVDYKSEFTGMPILSPPKSRMIALSRLGRPMRSTVRPQMRSTVSTSLPRTWSVLGKVRFRS